MNSEENQFANLVTAKAFQHDQTKMRFANQCILIRNLFASNNAHAYPIYNVPFLYVFLYQFLSQNIRLSEYFFIFFITIVEIQNSKFEIQI